MTNDNGHFTDIRRLSNTESSQLSRECICTALIYLMAEKEYDQISITEIVKRAGVSRATFYRNYATKENVIKDIVQEATNALQESVSNPLFKSDPKAWLMGYFAYVRENHEIFRCLLKSSVSKMEMFDLTYIRHFYPKITREEEYQVIGHLCGILSIVFLWIGNDMKESDERMAETVLEIYKPLKFL